MKLLIPIFIAVSLLLSSPVLAQERVSGIDVEAMDKTVRPQDDFYQYVNGAWIKATEMPADKSRYSMFSVLNDRTQEQLQTIIQEGGRQGDE